MNRIITKKIIFAVITTVLIAIAIIAINNNVLFNNINEDLSSNPPEAGTGLVYVLTENGATTYTDTSPKTLSSSARAEKKAKRALRRAARAERRAARELEISSDSTVNEPTIVEEQAVVETVANLSDQEEVVEVIEVAALVPTTSGVTLSGSDSTSFTVKHSAWESQFAMFPQDENGWSIIKPAVDSRLIYVSSTDGNDTNAKAYFSTDVTDPHNPPSNIIAFKTISEALKLQRDGYSDWVLLKKGDEWDSGTWYLKSGRSTKEPLVITSYGEYGDRPLVKTGTNSGVILKSGKSFIALTGIEFYANKRDPNGVSFAGWENVQSPSGFGSVVGWGQPSQAITLEDNVFDFYDEAVLFSGSSTQKNIVVRRNQLLNSYSPSSHSQGIFTNKTTMLLEENLIDHNGWYQQNYETLNSRAKGQATWFNHNIYISSPLDTVITGNLITRSSSIGIKVAGSANTETEQNSVVAENLIVSNNLFAEGEIGISAGGNKDFNNGYRFKNFTFKSNVMIHLGDSQPLRRTFSMGIQTVDWDGGEITGNQFLYTDNENVTNIHGVDISGLTRNVTVSDNVFKNLRDSTPVSKYNDEPVENLVIENNVAVNLEPSSRHDLTSYFNIGGEGNAVGTLVEKSKTQSKSNWNKAYTASEINKYLMN